MDGHSNQPQRLPASELEFDMEDDFLKMHEPNTSNIPSGTPLSEPSASNFLARPMSIDPRHLTLPYSLESQVSTDRQASAYVSTASLPYSSTSALAYSSAPAYNTSLAHSTAPAYSTATEESRVLPYDPPLPESLAPTYRAPVAQMLPLTSSTALATRAPATSTAPTRGRTRTYSEAFSEPQEAPVGMAREQQASTTIPQMTTTRTLLPLSRRRGQGASTESRPTTEVEQLQQEAAGIKMWGWRVRTPEEAPAFGATNQVREMFDERGTPVTAVLRADFTQTQRGKDEKKHISCDGGPTVFELQKRNIFHVNNMRFNLHSAPGQAHHLVLHFENGQKAVNRMILKLVGKKVHGNPGGESPTETQIGSRGKARKYRNPQALDIFFEAKYQKVKNGFTIHHDSIYGNNGALRDMFHQSHLEFLTATPGNKESGYWRLDSQCYYQVTLELWAYTGTKEDSCEEVCHDMDEMYKIAEIMTEPMVVRGRPPGARLTAEEKAKEKKRVTTKQPRTKRQKRQETPDEEDDADYMGGDMAAQGETQAPYTPHYALRGAAMPSYSEEARDQHESTTTGLDSLFVSDGSEDQASIPSANDKDAAATTTTTTAATTAAKDKNLPARMPPTAPQFVPGYHPYHHHYLPTSQQMPPLSITPTAMPNMYVPQGPTHAGAMDQQQWPFQMPQQQYGVQAQTYGAHPQQMGGYAPLPPTPAEQPSANILPNSASTGDPTSPWNPFLGFDDEGNFVGGFGEYEG